MKPMKSFNFEKGQFPEKSFSNMEKKPSKLKYINFLRYLSFIITGDTNQLTELPN